MLVDTHAHLNFKDFQKDLDEIIDRSVKAGVKKIICVSSNLEDSKNVIEIAKKYPGIVCAAVGIHPHNTSRHTDTPVYRCKEEIRELKKLAQEPEVVAIGECGLDYSPAPPGEKDRPRKEQAFIFHEQIKLAIQLNKPILVHSRKAFDDVVRLLSSTSEETGKPPSSTPEVSQKPIAKNQDKNTPGVREDNLPVCKKLRGVFHCYAAGKKGIEKVSQLGFYFGADGNLTYDKGLQNVFKEIPLEKILLETDCPFLAPEPHRGQRSEPVHVKIIAKFLANLKGVSFEKVAQITSQNVKKLFGIKIST